MKKALIATATIVTLVVFSGIVARPVSATYAPDFPSCPNPNGILVAQYASGTHGIAGESGSFVGSDSVYTINATQAVQCFCPTNGSGIQTNWLKLSDVSEQDIQTYKNLGWVFIPNGSEWGLENTSYIAQNLSFNCNGGGSVGGGSSSTSNWVCDSAKPAAPVLKSVVKSGTTATLTWSAVDMATHYLIFYGTQPGKWDYSVTNTGKVTTFTIGGLDPNTKYYFEVRSVNNCTPSDAPAIGGGEVLGLSTEFAPTGTLGLIAGMAVAGVVLMGASLVFKKHSARG